MGITPTWSFQFLSESCHARQGPGNLDKELSPMDMAFLSGHRLREPLGIPEGEVDPPAMVELTPRAGDAVLFENRTFHSAAPNTSDRVSKVVIFGYAYYRWMRVDPSLRLPDSELAAAAGEVEKQLLGGVPGEALPDTVKEWARENGLPVVEVPMTVEVPAG